MEILAFTAISVLGGTVAFMLSEMRRMNREAESAKYELDCLGEESRQMHSFTNGRIDALARHFGKVIKERPSDIVVTSTDKK